MRPKLLNQKQYITSHETQTMCRNANEQANH